MKKIVGIISIIVGAFFLITLLSWESTKTVMGQQLKWSTGGFAILFILFGLYAIASSIQDTNRANENYQIQWLLNKTTENNTSDPSKPKQSQLHISSEPIFKNVEENSDNSGKTDDFEPWKM